MSEAGRVTEFIPCMVGASKASDMVTAGSEARGSLRSSSMALKAEVLDNIRIFSNEIMNFSMTGLEMKNALEIFTLEKNTFSKCNCNL